MRKSLQKFSKDDSRLDGYSSLNMKRSDRTLYELAQIPVYTTTDDEEYYFEVEDY